MLPTTKINPPVFATSLFITVFFALFAAIFPELSAQYFGQLQYLLVTQVSWLYV